MVNHSNLVIVIVNSRNVIVLPSISSIVVSRCL